jgi:hypothetical protein
MGSAVAALTADIHPKDLEVTQRVLGQLAERARSLRAQLPG